MLAGENGSNITGLKFRGTVFPRETGPSHAEAKEIDQLVKQSSKEVVNEEILKIAHSIKHETIDEILAMDEIATGSSRTIEQDKNALTTLNAPLEITQKQPPTIN